jgi:hypothetical protein
MGPISDSNAAGGPNDPAEPSPCSVCGVKIQKMLGGDRVVFAYGPAGTREVLWNRVCRHIPREELRCLNRSAPFPMNTPPPKA